MVHGTLTSNLIFMLYTTVTSPHSTTAQVGHVLILLPQVMTGNRKLQRRALCRRGSLSILKVFFLSLPQAQPIPAELTAKLLGNRVAVSPIVTVEPRRRKFHKPITLTIPVPRAANKGMINQYSGDAPTLRLLCSITGM